MADKCIDLAGEASLLEVINFWDSYGLLDWLFKAKGIKITIFKVAGLSFGRLRKVELGVYQSMVEIMSSFIFTFVICPENARLYVAWAEESWASNNHNEPGVNYHMHALRHYHFSDGGAPWAAIRHDLNNVLDWGVGPRKTQILNLLDDVASKKKDGKKRART